MVRSPARQTWFWFSPTTYINGRNVTQYQFVDDLSVVKGNHTLRFGYNFRRADISDYDSQQNFAAECMPCRT